LGPEFTFPQLELRGGLNTKQLPAPKQLRKAALWAQALPQNNAISADIMAIL
jgi:hypothetical protein